MDPGPAADGRLLRSVEASVPQHLRVLFGGVRASKVRLPSANITVPEVYAIGTRLRLEVVARVRELEVRDDGTCVHRLELISGSVEDSTSPDR